MANATAIGYIEHGEPRLGIWCERCALPSAIEVEVYLLTAGPSISTLGTLVFCTECEQ